jgi:hypothetical protein
VLRLLRRHAVEARRVAEVLGRRHLLEERRLDRDPVHETAYGSLVRDDVVAEDPGRSAVGEEKCREQADKRRLPRTVLAEDGNGLSLVHRERDAAEGDTRALLAALAGILAAELLPQLAHLDGQALLNGHDPHDCFLYVDHLMLLRSRT